MNTSKAKKTTNIIIRIDTEMKENIEEIAKKDRRPLANYIRLMIENEIRNKSRK